jgi:hypothetical protein
MPRAGRVYKWLAAAGLLAMAALPVWAHASMEDYFAAGVAAAQRQEYARAIRLFESAARAGMRDPLLYYNFGVSYYRLSRLDKAEAAFLRSATSPKLAALSYYNLGLIARDSGRREQAISWFKQAEAAAQTSQMRALGNLALQQMTVAGTDPTASPAPWFIWAEGSIGYDSNAALATDFTPEAGGVDDKALGFSAYGQYDFSRLRAHALIDTEYYSELTDLDFQMLETGISLPLPGGGRELRPGLSLRHMRLGGQSLQDSATLLLESTVQADSGFQLKLYVDYESVTAGSGYQYLEGMRSSLRASVDSPAERWRFVWDIEFNEREDLFIASADAGDEFFSYSPRRQQWQLEYRDALTPVLDLRLAAGLQDSKYKGSEMRDGTVIQRRKDRRERLILELGYEHGNDWRSGLEVTYIERDSNFAEFDYDRNVLRLNVGRSFQ